MTRTLTRTHLHTSKLIRVLTDLDLMEVAAPGHSFAEDLSLWVDLNHAITLRTLHNAGALSAVGPAVAPSVSQPVTRGAALDDEYARVRDSFLNAMDKNGAASVARAQTEGHRPQGGEPLDITIAYEPYRRYCVAQQRDMGLSVRQLRIHARGVLAKASPALKTLADLDAAFDGVLSEREGKLLATVPRLLEQRFAQLYQNHQQGLTDVQQEDNSAVWMKPGAWLARFCQELQAVLVAELDVRLQPTRGLIEALDKKN